MTALSLLLAETLPFNDSIIAVINRVLIRLKVHPDVQLINKMIKKIRKLKTLSCLFLVAGN